MQYKVKFNRILNWLTRFFALGLAGYLVLLIPGNKQIEPVINSQNQFLWNQDSIWGALESEFNAARQLPDSLLDFKIGDDLAGAKAILDSIKENNPSPEMEIYSRLEEAIFHLGPLFAAQPKYLPQFTNLINEMRGIIKRQSIYWDMNSAKVRQRLYRLIYGGRAAIEEVMLQSAADSTMSLSLIKNEDSATPSAILRGVKIHSGDILVSRGGAATSALIARGNDYPGNFSHVALAYVDSQTGQLSILEAHIERGVTISTPEKYLGDTKLRIIILRPRSDLESLVNDPMIPHKAAKFMYDRAVSEHIAYDFQMDFSDSKKLFCSEVASAAYIHAGIKLWMGISSISSLGIARWLAAFGVAHFETQEPSDLEYDPQLVVVAEWRDVTTLYKDHLDNAVIDAMLEEAQKGEELTYDWYMLPIGRLAKGYSVVLNLFGKVGPVPEGMDAAAALRNKRFTRIHSERKHRLEALAAEFQSKRGYKPPYWELYRMALATGDKPRHSAGVTN